MRHVAVDAWAAKPKTTNDLGMSAIALDGYIPVIRASKKHRDNALSVQGEFSTGYGDADMFTNLNAIPAPTSPGSAYPLLPGGVIYTPDIDNGIVTYDGLGRLHGIQYLTYNFGLQYYLPGTDGKAWISGNYSHTESQNAHFYACAAGCATTPAKAVQMIDWFDVNFVIDPVPAVRIGIEYANFHTTYVDNINGSGVNAINHRGQLSGFFIF